MIPNSIANDTCPSNVRSVTNETVTTLHQQTSKIKNKKATVKPDSSVASTKIMN